MIEIDLSSFLFSVDFVGSVTVSWHGLFSFIAVATAVFLVARWAPLRGMDGDVLLSVAVWAIIGGVVGARLAHVIDQWSEIYYQRPIQMIYIWTGGVAIWGGVLGGLIGGVGYASVQNFWTRRKSDRLAEEGSSGGDGQADEGVSSRIIPIGIVADLTAPALLFVLAIGRLGDIVNGEHCAKATEWFYGFKWVHAQTAAVNCTNGWNNTVHPVIAMEMIWLIAGLALVWRLRGRLRPNGMVFVLFLGFYSIGRFFISFLREDRVWALGMQETQYISLVALVIVVPLLLVKARFIERVEEVPLVVERGTRAVRRRRRSKSRRKERRG
jgi:phosphatidylglycerol:prolipoprotein diacylglycerol transferase